MTRDRSKSGKTRLRAQQEHDLTADVPEQIVARSDDLSDGRLREMAMIDFVTDPDQRNVANHYSRVDRPWRKHVPLVTFAHWAQQGRWVERRAQWWGQIEARILAKRAEQMANQRITEIEAMESARECMVRYLFPLTTKNGSIRLHPEKDAQGNENLLAGLPMYGLRMPPLDRFVNAFIALDKQIMLKRGEATERAAGLNPSLPEVDAHEPDRVDSLSPEEMRAMARVLVRRRQPELNDQPEIVLEEMTSQGGDE